MRPPSAAKIGEMIYGGHGVMRSLGSNLLTSIEAEYVGAGGECFDPRWLKFANAESIAISTPFFYH